MPTISMAHDLKQTRISLKKKHTVQSWQRPRWAHCTLILNIFNNPSARHPSHLVWRYDTKINHMLTQTQPNSDHKEAKQNNKSGITAVFPNLGGGEVEPTPNLTETRTQREPVRRQQEENNGSRDRHKCGAGSKSFIRWKKKKCYSLYINN